MTDLTMDNQDQFLDVLPCLLVPVSGRNLLLPTVTVAEMAPYALPSRGGRGPEWYLGEIHWRNTLVPLLCYEVINGGGYPGVASRSRLAVCNTTGVSSELPFLAILTQGIPRLAQVENSLIKQEAPEENRPFDLMPVSIAAEKATIPDLAAMEQEFINLDLD
jgi:chemosensory pili system protein ChpC